MANSAFTPVANIPGGMTQLGRIVCAGSQASVTFGTGGDGGIIPSNYSDLMLIFTGRATGAGGATSLQLKFNNDATAGNYINGQFLLGTNTGVSAGLPGGQFVGNVGGTSGGANTMTGLKLTIPNYAGAVLPKCFFVENYQGIGTTTSQDFINGGTYTPVTPISRIDVNIAAGTILDGSCFTLYGLGTGPGNSRGYDEVTANPTTNLVDGRKVYRTDLDLLIVYKAALGKWLTVNEYALNFDQVSLIPLAATTSAGYAVARIDYQLYITRVALSLATVTTLNGSNYWTADFRWGTGASSETSLATTNTSADTVNINTNHDLVINAIVPNTARYFTLLCTKVNAPGNLYPHATAYYRLVIT